MFNRNDEIAWKKKIPPLQISKLPKAQLCGLQRGGRVQNI